MKRKSFLKLLLAVSSLCALSLACVGCGNDSTATNASKSKYDHRVILVSDMHYTMNDTPTAAKELYPDAQISEAVGPTFGINQNDKVQSIVDDINAFAERETVDAVFVLGDLTLDDYGYRNLPENYLSHIKRDLLDKLDYPYYTLAGNHDSYPNDDWKAVMGTDRQYSVKIGDAVFIMLDTFSDEIATGASGSPYISVDTDFLAEELEKYPTETIYLCSHYYKPAAADYKFTKLLRENDRIVCMFRGHTHNSVVLSPEEMAYKILVDIGGYAYDGDDSSGAWDFTQFNHNWAWGYQVLEWNETEAHIYHVKTPRLYTASNGTFNFKGAIEDDLIIPINKGDK